MTDNRKANGTELDDELDPGTIDQAPPPPLDDQGVGVENYISMRTYVSVEWIDEVVTTARPGTRFVIGYLAGVATAYEPRKSTILGRDGAPLPDSMWLKGQFEALAETTGEVVTSRWAVLPRQLSELVAGALEEGAERALFDVELGILRLPAGKGVPYRYTVKARGMGGSESENRRAVREIRARQDARREAAYQARLEAPKEAPMAPVEATPAKAAVKA